MVETLERSDIGLSPEPLYQMALGFATTKTLLAAQKLGLFKALGNAKRSAEELAQELDLNAGSTEMLLNACVSLKLCEKTGALYSNTPLAADFLIPGKRTYLGRFLEHFNDHMYPAWFYLEDAVRTGQAQIQRVIGEANDHFFQAIDHQSKDLETFMQTMEEHSLMEGKALAEAYDFSKHRELLDVGGGTGAMSVSIVEAYPHLRSTVFDRPPVCDIAKRNIEGHGQTDRIHVQEGDFFKGPFPQTADIVLLSGILHNWSPVNAQAILRQCATALAPGGTLLISEQILNSAKTDPLPAVLCSLNMLVMMNGGQEYSREEFESFLSAAGFELLDSQPTGGVRQLLIARRR